MSAAEARNRQVVERYWEAHFLRDWYRMATFSFDDAHYTDVGVDGQAPRARSRSSTGSTSASSIGNVVDPAPQWWIQRIAQDYAAVGGEAG